MITVIKKETKLKKKTKKIYNNNLFRCVYIHSVCCIIILFRHLAYNKTFSLILRTLQFLKDDIIFSIDWKVSWSDSKN